MGLLNTGEIQLVGESILAGSNPAPTTLKEYGSHRVRVARSELLDMEFNSNRRSSILPELL